MEQQTAAIYARVSSPGTRQNTDRQIADLTELAAQYRYSLVRVFDEHLSGAVSGRPVLEECVDYCVANHIDVLLVSEMSRLGRSVDDLIRNINRLRDAKVDVYMQKENFHTLQHDGTPHPFLAIFVAVLGTAAAMERECIMHRLISGRKRYVESGGVVGRKPGNSKSDTQILKEYKSVARELKRGTSIRRTAKICGCAPSTVQKVKQALKSLN